MSPTTTMPFRFLDLWPEIRNMIYILIVSQPSAIEPRNIVAPAITTVSKQLRDESLKVFFWENTFRVRVFSDVQDGPLWAIVAYYTPTLSLEEFLNEERHGLRPYDSGPWEEMRDLTASAGLVQIELGSMLWLKALPPGTVRFRRVDFIVFDDWSHYDDKQPVEQLELAHDTHIPDDQDPGFEINWFWRDHHQFTRFPSWFEWVLYRFKEDLQRLTDRKPNNIASLGPDSLYELALAFRICGDGTPAGVEFLPTDSD